MLPLSAAFGTILRDSGKPLAEQAFHQHIPTAGALPTSVLGTHLPPDEADRDHPKGCTNRLPGALRGAILGGRGMNGTDFAANEGA
jgi:hypothetical protein